MFVEPLNRQLQRTPGVKARRARVGIYRRLGLACRVKHGGPFLPEKSELAQVATLFITLFYGHYPFF